MIGKQALQYPDAKEWVLARDVDLNQLDRTSTIRWISTYIKPPSNPLPITIGYRYKWTTGFKLLKRKNQRALRGDFMIPFVHFDPDQTTAPMVNASSVRLLFALKAMHNLQMEHFDITGAFLHQAFGYEQTVYVNEMCRADQSFKHGNTCGILHGNMYFGKSSGYSFLKGLTQRLNEHGYFPTDFDRCLYFKKDGNSLTIFSVCINAFLVVIQRDTMIDNLFNVIQAKYWIKRW